MTSLLIHIYYIFVSYLLAQEPPRSPAEELLSFKLADPNLKIELVASEPMVQDPILALFDAQKRLWVVEMRGYMPDIEANGENAPVGRVSVLEDRNYDGQMDYSTVFMDSLIMPRAIAFIKNGILIAENGALYEVLDQNNDLKPDSKALVDKEYAGNPSPEHSGNGLLQGLDGWFYNAKSKKRYKKQGPLWLKDSTEFRGQFGLTMNDAGRLLYNYNWSQLHGDLVPPNYLWHNKNHNAGTGIDYGYTTERSIYPLRDSYATNRGYIPGTLDKSGRLLEFTAACSPLLYRSQALGSSYYGNAFVCEPVGNLVKRNIIEQQGVFPVAKDPLPGTEFLASTDERFRPVSLSYGPDGSLYVIDMYKGIMQHALYETPYLKEQYLKRGLDKHLNKGRIWRIVAKDYNNPALSETNNTLENLIQELYSWNAWQRETAARQIAEQYLPQAKTQLTKMVNYQPGPNVRIGFNSLLAKHQAFWLLANSNNLTKNQLLALLTESYTPTANDALQMAEKLIVSNSTFGNMVVNKLLQILPNSTEEHRLQYLLSAYVLAPELRLSFLQKVVENQKMESLFRDALLSSLHGLEWRFFQKTKDKGLKTQSAETAEILTETLVAAILKNNKAIELDQLLAAATNNQMLLEALLSLAKANEKAINISKRPIILAKLPENKRLALEKLFSWPGKIASSTVASSSLLTKPEDLKSFARGRQQYLNVCSGCHGTQGKGMARIAPPLAGSQWVTGSEQRLALLVLHGIEGAIQVNGHTYDAPQILPTMPAMSNLDDPTITNILNYIRNEWGNNAGPINRILVSRTRHTTQGRVQPWSVAELNRHIDSLAVITPKKQ
jgi:mono/diheme cytochrome c family protein